MARKSDKLLVSLFKYYITFVLVLAGIFVLSYFYLGYEMSRSIENSKVPILDLINGKYSDVSNLNINDLNKLGGYIEILDENRIVVRRIGGKRIDETKQYSEEELLETVGMNSEDKEYYVFLSNFIEDGNHCKALVRIPTEKISLVLNVFSVPYSLGKPLYALYIKVISIALVLSIVSIILYSVWTAKKIKKPLREIDDALGKIIDGEYDDKLTLDGAKEFILVSNTINYLVDRLKQSKEENKRLEESKTRMLIDLSHDIKTPITTIRGFSAALYEGIVEDKEHEQRYLKTIYNKSERVAELVDDLFEFVKMDSVQYTLKLEKVDICEFVRQIVVDYVDELDQREFNLVVNIPETVGEIKVDTRLFKRVITNLIENSIKYNPNRTTIRVEVRDASKYIVIEVADNGIGIPDTIKDKAFEPFVRGDESRKSDGGSGLGLAIVKKIVENHGGEIELLRRNGKEKTIFYIKMYREV